MSLQAGIYGEAPLDGLAPVPAAPSAVAAAPSAAAAAPAPPCEPKRVALMVVGIIMALAGAILLGIAANMTGRLDNSWDMERTIEEHCPELLREFGGGGDMAYYYDDPYGGYGGYGDCNCELILPDTGRGRWDSQSRELCTARYGGDEIVECCQKASGGARFFTFLGALFCLAAP